MRRRNFVVILMGMILLFITGCDEESTAPDPYSNGMLITLFTPEGEKEFNANKYVSCHKDINNIVTFLCEDSDENSWIIKFVLDNDVQNGDTIYISDNTSNEITLNTPNDEDLADYFINSGHFEASETFIKIINFVDGENIEAKLEGYIYETGGGVSADSLKNGYFITSRFE